MSFQKASILKSDFKNPCWTVSQHLILCHLLKLDQRLIEQSLKTQRLVFSAKGTQLWCLNTKADRWQLVSSQSISELVSRDAVKSLLRRALDNGEESLLDASPEDITKYFTKQFPFNRQHNYFGFHYAELEQLSSLFLKARDNRHYYQTCWHCGELCHKSQLEDHICADCLPEMKEDKEGRVLQFMLGLIDTSGVDKRDESSDIRVEPEYIDGLYLPMVDYGAHPHGVVKAPSRVVRFESLIPAEDQDAIKKAKLKLVMNRRFFQTCPNCGRWYYVAGKGRMCDRCAHKVYGIVH